MRKKITIILMLALFMLVSAPVSARTFVLSIGIADYDGDEHDLQRSGQDAIKFSDYLVVSTTAAPSQPLADPGMFGGKSAAMFVNLSKTSPAAQSIKRAFGIDLDLTAISYSDKHDNLFELKVNNNKQDNVLAYLVDLVLKISEI